MTQDDWAQYEIREARGKVQRIPLGDMHQRIYSVPGGIVEQFPRKGIVPGYNGGETNSLLKPRISNVRTGKQRDGINQEVIVTVIQPVAYGS